MALSIVNNVCIHAVRATFLRFPAASSRGAKAVICGLQRVATQRAHGQHGAHMRAPSPHGAPAPQGPPGRHGGAPRRPRPRCAAACASPTRGVPAATSGHTPAQGPGHAATGRRVLATAGWPGASSRRSSSSVAMARLAPGHRGLDVLCQALARPRQAVRCRGPHAAQGLAAPQEGAPLLRLGVGQRPGRRADHVGTVGQGLWSPGPPFRVWNTETVALPRSRVPPVKTCPALRPRWCPAHSPSRTQDCGLPALAQPSASHDSTHFGAQSRGLPSRYTRLRTAPCGEARGFAPDLLARR